MRADRLAPLALVAAVALLTGCDDSTKQQRCAEMSEYLDGRALDFDRACVVDTDCAVVFVRPGEPLAVNGSQPDDPALERVIAEYEAQCAPLPRGEGAPYAVCEQRILESADPNDPTQAIYEVLDQICVLRGSWTAEDVGVDAGNDTGDAGDSGDAEGSGEPRDCQCESDAECGGERCVACGCVPDTRCGDACEAAAACGATDALQLAPRGDVCAASCEAALERDARFDAFVDCLNEQPCGTIATCGGLLP